MLEDADDEDPELFDEDEAGREADEPDGEPLAEGEAVVDRALVPFVLVLALGALEIVPFADEPAPVPHASAPMHAAVVTIFVVLMTLHRLRATWAECVPRSSQKPRDLYSPTTPCLQAPNIESGHTLDIDVGPPLTRWVSRGEFPWLRSPPETIASQERLNA